MSRSFARLTATEAKLLLREPLAVFWSLVFPIILLVAIGASSSGKREHSLGGLRLIDAYVPVLMVFVLAIVSLSALPAGLASHRDKGYLRRLATTPVGAPRLLSAQLLVNLAVVALAVIAVAVVASAAFAVSMPGQVVGFVLALGLSALAMLACGIVIAAVAPSQRTAGLIGSMVFFPMMFFAGLWGPRAQMGTVVRHISDYTPLGAAVGAVQPTLAGHWPSLAHLAVLAAYAVVLGLAAARLFRWDR